MLDVTSITWGIKTPLLDILPNFFICRNTVSLPHLLQRLKKRPKSQYHNHHYWSRDYTSNLKQWQENAGKSRIYLHTHGCERVKINRVWILPGSSPLCFPVWRSVRAQYWPRSLRNIRQRCCWHQKLSAPDVDIKVKFQSPWPRSFYMLFYTCYTSIILFLYTVRPLQYIISSTLIINHITTKFIVLLKNCHLLFGIIIDIDWYGIHIAVNRIWWELS